MMASTMYFQAAQVPIKCAARVLVRIDVLVNAFVADRRLAFQSEPSGNLRGASPLAQEKFNLLSGRGLMRRSGRAVANSCARVGR
jgi:hypothetical protein